MHWNVDTQSGQFLPSHFTEGEIQELANASKCSWHDAEAFLKNAVSNTLHPNRESFENVLIDSLAGEYGVIEGACSRYESRHFT